MIFKKKNHAITVTSAYMYIQFIVIPIKTSDSELLLIEAQSLTNTFAITTCITNSPLCYRRRQFPSPSVNG